MADSEDYEYIKKNMKGVSDDVVDGVTSLFDTIRESNDCAMFGMSQKGKLITIEFETGADE